MLNTFGVHIKRIFQRFSNNINSMPQVNTEKHTRISKTKVKKFETAESLFPTVSFQVGSSPSLLTVNRGRGQREGRVPSWQENCFLQLPPRFSPARFQRFSRYRLLLLAPFLRRRGSFCNGTLLFRLSFSKFSFSIFDFEKQKRRMRAFHPPRCLDAKKFLIRLFVIQFFFASWVKTSPT